LQDGQSYAVSGSNRFRYKNSIMPTWRQTWTRIQVRVWSSEVFKVEIVSGEEQLQDLEKFSVWAWLQSLLRERHNETTINISLFSKKTCFRIEPVEDSQYTVKCIRTSQVFFYSAGIGTGTIASLIILFFVLARLLPKKSPFYLFLVGGWSFSVYAIQLVFRNLSVILQEHWHVALGIQIQQVAFAIIISALISKHLEYPITLAVAAWRRVWTTGNERKIRRFRQKPEPRRLLTEEEYQKQAEEETRRGLEELRKHCSSPEFNPWKTVSRLQSPQRFADFVEGSPHLMSNEVSVHAQEYGFGGMIFEDTDDEDEEEDAN
ncbi:unnamed protein product, partial [Tetraodon nigroviridis]